MTTDDRASGFGTDGPAPPDYSVLPVLPPDSAQRLDELPLRPRSSMWDRLKIIFGLVALWWILVWATITNNPTEPFQVAVSHELTT